MTRTATTLLLYTSVALGKLWSNVNMGPRLYSLPHIVGLDGITCVVNININVAMPSLALLEVSGYLLKVSQHDTFFPPLSRLHDILILPCSTGRSCARQAPGW